MYLLDDGIGLLHPDALFYMEIQVFFPSSLQDSDFRNLWKLGDCFGWRSLLFSVNCWSCCVGIWGRSGIGLQGACLTLLTSSFLSDCCEVPLLFCWLCCVREIIYVASILGVSCLSHCNGHRGRPVLCFQVPHRWRHWLSLQCLQCTRIFVSISIVGSGCQEVVGWSCGCSGVTTPMPVPIMTGGVGFFFLRQRVGEVSVLSVGWDISVVSWPHVVLFQPGLAWKPRLWPGLRQLWPGKIPGRAKAVNHGLALAWLGLGHSFCMQEQFLLLKYKVS